MDQVVAWSFASLDHAPTANAGTDRQLRYRSSTEYARFGATKTLAGIENPPPSSKAAEVTIT